MRTVYGKCFTSSSFQINLDTIGRKNLADLNVCSSLEEEVYIYIVYLIYKNLDLKGDRIIKKRLTFLSDSVNKGC